MGFGGSNGSMEKDANTLENGLEDINSIIEKIGARPITFFLDFDGTLSEIVSDPSKAKLGTETREVLEKIAELYPTTIVTGRGLDKVKSFVPVPGLTYAGSHGFDMEGPSVGRVTMGKEHKKALTDIMNKLRDTVDTIPGAEMEDNDLSVSIHYRHVADEKVDELFKSTREEVGRANLELRNGKKVWEIRPKFDWHKGKAVDYLMGQLSEQDKKKMIPIYIGDDVTDEDAFGVLKPYGGIGLLVYDTVAHENLGGQRMTKADAILRNPKEVCEFLRHFVTNNRVGKYGGFATKGMGKLKSSSKDVGATTHGDVGTSAV